MKSTFSTLVALVLAASASASSPSNLSPHNRHRRADLAKNDFVRLHRVVKRADLLSNVINAASSTDAAASTAAASTDAATSAAASTAAAATSSAAAATTSQAASTSDSTDTDSSTAAATSSAAATTSSSSTDSSSSSSDSTSSSSDSSSASVSTSGASSASGSTSGSSSGSITSSGSQSSTKATKTTSSSSSVDTSTLTGSARASASAAAVKSAATAKTKKIKTGVIIAIASAGGGALLLYLIWTIVRKTKFSTSRKFEDRLAPVEFIGGDANDSFERDGHEHDAIVDHAGGTGRSAYAPSVARSDSGGKASNFGGGGMSEYGHGLNYQSSSYNGREPAAMGYSDLQRGNSQATTLGANLQRGQSGLSNGAGIERSYSPYDYNAHAAAQRDGRY